MKKQSLYEAFNAIDRELIEEAESARPAKSRAAVLRTVLIAAAAVVLIAALCVGGVFMLKKQGAPALPGGSAASAEEQPEPAQSAATVYLDVNPSLKIDIDAQKTALRVAGINDDGKALLRGSDLSGQPIENVVKALIGLTVDQGYLNASNNTVLLSVESDSSALATELSASLNKSVREVLDDRMPDGKIISQTLERGRRITELNNRYFISLGRAKCIVAVLDASADYSLEELLNLDVSALVDLCEKLGVSDDKKPVDVAEALEIVLADAAKNTELPIDRIKWESCISSKEDGEAPMRLYEFRFTLDSARYTYRIDAETGEILWKNVTVITLDSTGALDRALEFYGFKEQDLDLSARSVVYCKRINAFRVYLKLKSGVERLALVDAGTGDVTPAGGETLLDEEGVKDVVFGDLGVTDAQAEILGDPWSDWRVRCTVRTEKSAFHYIVDRASGEILYKEETGRDETWTNEFSIAAATLTARALGAEEIETLSFGQSAEAPYNAVAALLLDGSYTVFQLTNGVVVFVV